MPIEFRCSDCGKLLRVPDGTAGKQAMCPACGATLTVPTPEFAPPPAPAGAAPPQGGPSEPGFAPPGGPPGSETPNPYQSPSPYSAAVPPPASPYAYAVDRDYALAKVSGPATWLIVTGALGLLLQVVGIFFNLLQIGGPGFGPQPQVNDPAVMVFASAYSVVGGLVGIGLSVLVIAGAVKMQRLENYGLAMAAAVIAIPPCVSPCCLLGLPIGIWAVIVLSDPRVKAAFRR